MQRTHWPDAIKHAWYETYGLLLSQVCIQLHPSQLFILRSRQGQVQQERSRLLDGSPEGPLLLNLYSKPFWTRQAGSLKNPPGQEKQRINAEQFQACSLHICVCEEEKEGRNKPGRHYNIASCCRNTALRRDLRTGAYSLWGPRRAP